MKTKTLSFLMPLVLTLSMLVMLPALPANAASGGPNYPGTGQTVTGVGTVAWNNPGNVVSDNNSNATATLGNSTTNYLQGTNYGFAIPANATIAGIQVEIGRYRSGGSTGQITDNVVRLVKGGTVVGDNKAATGTNWPTSEGVASYGGSADLWGETWTPADVNATDFGVVLAATSGGNRTANVDYIRVTVTYYIVELNGDLLPGCAIKVALVLDASTSIDATSQQLVRNAANAFLSALADTGSEVAIVEFGTLADTPVPYTVVTSANIVLGQVFGNYLSPTDTTGPQYHDNRDTVDGGTVPWTNWDHAFYTTNTLDPKPDLVVFVTDGIPTARAGYPGSGAVVTGGSTTPPPTPAMIDAAVASANLVKTNNGNGGFGSHIFAVGVTGSTGLDLGSLFAVLDAFPPGNTEFTATPISNFDEADYTTTTNFAGLETALRNIALELCASSLTVTKLVDPGTGIYAPAQNWTFTANVAPSTGDWSWKQPCLTLPGNPAPCAGDTNANGQIFFQWLLDDVNATTTSVSIAETPQQGFEFVDVSCTVSGVSQPVPQQPTFTVSGIARTAAASCTVRNRAIPSAVTLGDFSAQCVSGSPVITWETVSELTNQGFNLYRGVDSANPDTQINGAMIPSQGPGSTQGFVYTWTDDTAQAGNEYWYWLGDVDFSGVTTMHGPISAMCSAPTAVTLSGLDASGPTPNPALWWAVALALAAVLGGLVAIQRRSKA